MARSRLVAGVLLVSAVIVGGWLWLSRSSAEADRLAVLAAAPSATRASSFAESSATASGAEDAATAQPTALVPTGPQSLASALPAASVRLSGRVVRPDGSPVADADVRFAESATAAASAEAATTRTLADGSFALTLAETDAQLFLGKDDWLLARAGVADAAVREVPRLAPGERDVGSIVLPGGAALRGRVIAPDGTPGHDIVVTVHTLQVEGQGGAVSDPFEYWDPHKVVPEVNLLEDADLQGLDPQAASAIRSLRRLTTGPDGSFAFAGLPAGAARLEIEPRRARQVVLDRLALHAGGVLDVGDIALDEGLILEGVVLTAAGAPADRASVRAQRERPPAAERDGNIERTGRSMEDQWTDASGRFRLVGLARGTYQIVAQAAGQAATVVEAEAGDRDVQVRLLEGATVLLELRDARTDAPLLEATITGRAELHLLDGSTLGLPDRFSVTHGPET